MRPWWLSTLSLALLSTDRFQIKGDLSPGMCPYYPSLTLDDLYLTNTLLQKTFNIDQYGLTTILWQDGVKFPSYSPDSRNSSYFRKIIQDTNIYEKWTQIIKLNETNYELHNIQILSSLVTTAALICSVILALLIGLLFLYSMVYVTNFVHS